MEFYYGRDILDFHTLTVMEDRSLFDSVDTATIREHFRQWAENTYRSEQQQPGTGNDVRMGTSPRYRYCIQVDAAALHSVVHNSPPPPQPAPEGWVKLIEKDWILRSQNPLFRNHPDSNVHEPIEGVTEYDVGWVKCLYQDVMSGSYASTIEWNNWGRDYQRPPMIVG